jgi:hypothetical protein
MIVETLRNLELNAREQGRDGDEHSAPESSHGSRHPSHPAREAVSGDHSARAPESGVEPFDPLPSWVRPAGLIAVGLVIGFVIGRIV